MKKQTNTRTINSFDDPANAFQEHPKQVKERLARGHMREEKRSIEHHLVKYIFSFPLHKQPLTQATKIKK